jgi:epoxyqueuosine reductase
VALTVGAETGDPRGVDRYTPQADPPLAQASQPLDAASIQACAGQLGFSSVGIGAAASLPLAERRFQAWLASGHAGAMRYMREPRLSPAQLLPGARSVIAVGMSHGAASTQREGAVAGYARGTDYHQVLKQRLRALARQICERLGRPLRARACVDTAPIFERAWAERLGLGFIGKSTMLITPGVGSSQLLGVLLLDVALPALLPTPQAGCGSCQRCIEACPTRAFTEDYVLDARRCISYLTIEFQGWIDRDLRALIGNHLFGCDICQTTCPFNWSDKLPAADPELAPRATLEVVDPRFVLELTTSEHRRWTKSTALRRASRAQLQRNAAVVLGNNRDPEALSALLTALFESRYPIVRGHVAWALGRYRTDAARDGLARARSLETDSRVLEEIELALSDGG